MPYVFDLAVVRDRLESLEPWKRLAFGVFLLERAVPNFLRFQTETGAPGGPIIAGALAKSWQILQSGEHDIFASLTHELCAEVAPDTEHYSSLYTSAALDAASIAANILEFLESGDIGLIAEAASLRRDTIDIFAQVADGLGPSAQVREEAIQSHRLMQQELAAQDEDLLFLERAPADGTQGWPLVLARSLDLQYNAFTLRVDG